MQEWKLDYQYLTSLVNQAQIGDNDAFAELYLATYKKVYRFALQYLKDEQDALDAVQETYIVVFRKLGTLKNPQLFVSWLNQIAFRVCFGIHKKRMEEQGRQTDLDELNDKTTSAASQPENIVVSIDEKNYIIRSIMSLPFSESQVLLLRYYNDMKIEDIAYMLDLSKSSVKRYLASGKQKLGQLIER